MTNPRKPPAVWQIIDDFDHLTAYGARCTNCGNIKQDHHVGVFRPQNMDEVDGFHDLCEDCVANAAFALGFTPEEDYLRTVEELATLKEEHELLRTKYEGARSAQMTLARENVALQDLLEEAVA
jgi:hypothetical protein